MIATKNEDKFRLVKDLLEATHLEGDFLNLNSVEEYKAGDERGTIVQRAETKAKHFYDWSVQQKLDFDIIIGIDDGFILPGQYENADSESITKKLLTTDEISTGERVTLCREYSFLRCKDQETWQFRTEIPYIYLGRETATRFEQQRYPLRSVLAFEGSKKPLSEETEDIIQQKNIEYAIYKLEPLINEILKKSENKESTSELYGGSIESN